MSPRCRSISFCRPSRIWFRVSESFWFCAVTEGISMRTSRCIAASRASMLLVTARSNAVSSFILVSQCCSRRTSASSRWLASRRRASSLLRPSPSMRDSKRRMPCLRASASARSSSRSLRRVDSSTVGIKSASRKMRLLSTEPALCDVLWLSTSSASALLGLVRICSSIFTVNCANSDSKHMRRPSVSTPVADGLREWRRLLRADEEDVALATAHLATLLPWSLAADGTSPPLGVTLPESWMVG
mmetsp:Transcript_99843/g.257963  ORF Transcript_99843/g.257963 Transcript_99843/m.257963 type:complete len:244 (-) Transcript_99843:241-972(-)